VAELAKVSNEFVGRIKHISAAADASCGETDTIHFSCFIRLASAVSAGLFINQFHLRDSGM